jgi:hypothetical protein
MDSKKKSVGHVPMVGTGKDVAILDSCEHVTYQR